MSPPIPPPSGPAGNCGSACFHLSLRATDPQFLCFLRRKSSSRLFHQLFSAGLTSDEEGGENGATGGAYLVKVPAGDFVDNPVGAKHPQLASEESGAAAASPRVRSRLSKECGLQVFIANPPNHVLAPVDDFQQPHLRERRDAGLGLAGLSSVCAFRRVP
jgi:hypothetical protein